LLPANLVIKCNLILELIAKQEGRKQLRLYLKLKARTMAKNVHIK